MIKIKEFNSLNEVDDIQHSWDNILLKSKDNDVFSTWEWLCCWWKHFGKFRQLKVLVAEEEGKILGIAPLMLSVYNLMNFGKIRKIEFIGSPYSDYNNFILMEKERKCVEGFLDYLMDDHDWDFLELRDVHEDSVSEKLLHEVRDSTSWKLDFRVDTLCPYISLPNSFSAFTNKLGPNMRRNTRRRMKKLCKEYNVEFSTHLTFDSIKDAMDSFFVLHQKRWKTKDEPGAFASKAFSDFHVDIAESFAEKNWLYLYFLLVDDKPTAAIYSFNYNQKIYEYLTGFDPVFENYGVGNLLKMHLIETCIQKGIKEYDLLRGYASYKCDWTDKARKNYEVQFIHKGLFARLYGQIRKNDFLRTTMRKISKPITPKS